MKTNLWTKTRARVIALTRASMDVARVLCGAAVYRLTGTTPVGASIALIRLFCISGGNSNDWMCRAVQTVDKGSDLPKPDGLLGVRDRQDAERIADGIRKHGYHVFRERLPDEICDRLLQFALNTPARVRPMDGAPTRATVEAVYDRKRPLAPRYDFRMEDVINLPDVQRLMADPSLLWVGQSYLETTPVADVTTMWWHTAFSDQPDEEAGQLYHFDMDRIKWLKFFIYLTDVEPANGPHCFVKGSHRTRGIPFPLLSKGYARIRDAEVFQYYARETEVRFVAPRGTVIAEDTRGLHKGLEVLSGDRLMLQLQLSNSLFGAPYAPTSFRRMTPELEKMAQAYPAIYKGYAANGSA